MVKAISVNSTKSFTLEQEKELPAEEQTHFVIGCLTGNEWIEVTAGSLAIQDVENNPEMTRISIQMAQKAAERKLLGWSNLRGEDGQQVAFPGRGHRALDLLPWNVILAIGMEILNYSRLEGSLGGKSTSSSAS